MSVKFTLNKILQLNLKTIFFNIITFKFKDAIKFPVLIHSKVKILNNNGEIILPEKIDYGMVKIGYGGAIFDHKKDITVFQNSGLIEFKGSASFGNGSVISVLKEGKLVVGDHFSGGARNKYLCRKKLEIGNDVLLSWDIQIMDTDFHHIFDQETGVKLNESKAVKISDKVWIGADSKVLKGVSIAKGCIIAASSTISKTITEENVIVGTQKQQVIKKNISWKK